MRVHELIKILEQHDPDAIIVVDGYEWDFDEVETIEKILISPLPEEEQSSWRGKLQMDINGAPAVYFPRQSD